MKELFFYLILALNSIITFGQSAIIDLATNDTVFINQMEFNPIRDSQEVISENILHQGSPSTTQFYIKEPTNVFLMQIDGPSQLSFSQLELRLDKTTSVHLCGFELRGALVIPTHVKIEFIGDRWYLSSEREYNISLRLPVNFYYNYHSVYENDWETAVSLTGTGIRYAQLRLVRNIFGKNIEQYAHYFPNALDSIVFYLPEKRIETIIFGQVKGRSCFDLNSLYLIRKGETVPLVLNKEVVSSMVTYNNSTSLCLSQDRENDILINAGYSFRNLKIALIALLAMIMFFFNKRYFTK